MRGRLWGLTALALLAALSCSGEEFAADGSGGASTGGSGNVAIGGVAGAGAVSSGGAAGSGGTAGAAGGSGGSAGAGGSVSADASTDAGDASAGGTGGTTTCPAPKGPTLLTATGDSPEYPVVVGTDVYFTTDKTVVRVPANGGTSVVLHTDVAPSNNEGIAVLTHNVYWADAGRGELRHVDTTAGNAFSVVESGQAGIQTMAVSEGFVYWAYQGGIRRRQNTVQNLYASPGAYAIAVGEVDVFWVTLGGAVMRGPKGGTAEGGSATTLETKANPLGGNWDAVSIALDATDVYWTARVALGAASLDSGAPPDAVYRVPRTGGTAQQVFATSGAEGIALSTDCMYVGSRGAANVGRVYVRQKSLGGQILNLGGFQYPRGLAIAGPSIYITDTVGGTVQRATL